MELELYLQKRKAKQYLLYHLAKITSFCLYNKPTVASNLKTKTLGKRFSLLKSTYLTFSESDACGKCLHALSSILSW